MQYFLVILIIILPAWVVYRWPMIAMAMLAAAMPFDIPLKAGITIFSTEACLLGMSLGMAARIILHKEAAPLRWRELLAGIPFLLAIALSGIHADSLATIVKGWLRALEFLLAIWLAINLLQQESEVRQFQRIFLAVAVGLALLGLAQTLLGLRWGVAENFPADAFAGIHWQRAQAWFGHPNQFAGFLLLVLPMVWLYFLKAQGWNQRLKLSLLLLPLLGALVFSLCRAAWVAFLITALGLVLLTWKIRFFIITLIVLETGLAVMALDQGPLEGGRNLLMHRLNTLRHVPQTESWNSRLRMYRIGWSMWQTHPWLGMGAGTYPQQAKVYFSGFGSNQNVALLHIHNLYLQILIETGILGLAAFLGMLAYFVRLLWRSRASGPDGLLIGGVLAGAFAFLLHNLADVLMVYGRGVHFGLLLGMGLALVRVVPQPIRAEKSVEVIGHPALALRKGSVHAKQQA